jgi:chemotaxis signal transduction protein
LSCTVIVTDSAVAAGLGVPLSSGPQWVVFTCDGRRFVVPLERVREILTPQPLTRLPGCGPEVAGLAGIRGRVVTTFDFGVLLTARPSAAVDDHRLLLIEQGDRLVGAVVDEVVTVSRAQTETFLPGEPGFEGLLLRTEDVTGAGRVDGEPFVSLNLDAILGRVLA